MFLHLLATAVVVACASCAPLASQTARRVGEAGLDIAVTQRDGQAGAVVVVDGEARVRVVGGGKGVLTGWRREGGVVEMRFDGRPGRVTVAVGGGREVRVDVRGIGVRGRGYMGMVSGVFRRGIVVGRWEDWVGEARWVVVPVESYGVGVQGARVELRAIVGSAAEARAGGVEAVDLAGRGRVCGFVLRKAGGNARVYEEGGVRRGGVDAEDGCGVAVTAGGEWMAVRIEKYLVGSGAWQVVLEADGVWSVLNFWFSKRRSTVPPVVLLGGGLPTLDPFGGEVVELNRVHNLFAPPRERDLRAADVVLAVFDGDKEVGRGSAVWVEKTGDSGAAKVVLRTPVVDDGVVTNTKLLFRDGGWRGNFLVAAVVRQFELAPPRSQEEQEVVVVADSGADAFADDQLAKRGECGGLFTNQTGTYTEVSLLLPTYSSARFSHFKAGQISDALATAVGVRSSAVHFISFSDASSAGIFEVAGGAGPAAVEEAVSAAVSDGSIAGKARLADADVALGSVRSSGDESLACTAPAIVARDDGEVAALSALQGARVSALPWLVSLLTVSLFAFFGVLGCGQAKQGCFGKEVTMTALLSSLQDDRGSSLSSASSFGAKLPPANPDRLRTDSFGLHEGEDSRRLERISIIPDSESDTGAEPASGLETPTYWPGSRQASADLISDEHVITRATASGSRSPYARRLFSTHSAESSLDDELEDGTRGYDGGVGGMYSVEESEDGGNGSHTSHTSHTSHMDWESRSAASSLRRISRDEIATGYLARFDPLVARLTYALRTARNPGSADTDEDSFVARDEARPGMSPSGSQSSFPMEDRPRPQPQPGGAEYRPANENGSTGSVSGSGSGGVTSSSNSRSFSRTTSSLGTGSGGSPSGLSSNPSSGGSPSTNSPLRSALSSDESSERSGVVRFAERTGLGFH